MTDIRLGKVLQPKSTKGFVEEFRKSLTDKMARFEPAEIENLIEKLAEIHVADELKEATESFLKLADSNLVDGVFLNPANFNGEAPERFRGGFDSVITLQKLFHQHLAEVNPE